MLKEKITLLLCLFCVSECLARSPHPGNIKYNYRVDGGRQTINRGTTPRPILQQYWQSFVSNLPTLPPISWNITNPIGNLFNGNAEQVIETPVVTNMMKANPPDGYHKRSKGPELTNYYTTYSNNYQQMQLQPLGLDHNRIMHFYEPSSGQYYALQVESQPSYYNSQYENPYNNPYLYHYNQYNNYGGYYEDNNRAGGEDEYYYQNGGYNSEYGHDSNQQYYSENSAYNSDIGNYDHEDSTEYDDGVELADNWGYDDDEIFADRKLKGGSNKLDTIAKGIVKIQKHLLTPETEKDAKLSLSKHRIDTHKEENMSKQKKPVESDKESGRNAMGNFMKSSGQIRKAQTIKVRDSLRLANAPRKQMEYYIFPTNIWL